jgi:hypothetical protein
MLSIAIRGSMLAIMDIMMVAVIVIGIPIILVSIPRNKPCYSIAWGPPPPPPSPHSHPLFLMLILHFILLITFLEKPNLRETPRPPFPQAFASDACAKPIRKHETFSKHAARALHGSVSQDLTAAASARPLWPPHARDSSMRSRSKEKNGTTPAIHFERSNTGFAS